MGHTVCAYASRLKPKAERTDECAPARDARDRDEPARHHAPVCVDVAHDPDPRRRLAPPPPRRIRTTGFLLSWTVAKAKRHPPPEHEGAPRRSLPQRAPTVLP